MIRCVLSILFTLLLAPVFHCSGKLEQLKEIESFIQECPDSALNALNALDVSCLKTRREKALFSLLKTMALDKNYNIISDDKIIEEARLYYKNHRADDHYASALFYSGRACFDNGNYQDAILYYQQALEETHSYYWRSLIFSHMGYTYIKCFNNEEELSCNLKTLEYAKLRKDSMAIRQSMSSLATAYHNNRMDASADSLLNILVYSDNPFYVAFPQWADIKIKQKNPDYKEVVYLFETGISNDIEMTVEYWCEYAYALFKCGRKKQAESIFKQLEHFGDNLHIAYWKSKVDEVNSDFEAALREKNKYEHLADSLVKAKLSQSLFKAQASHYKIASELETVKRKKSTMTAAVIILAILSGGVIVVVTYRRKQRELSENMERLANLAEESETMLMLVKKDLSKTKTDLDETELKLQKLRQLYAKSYQAQFAEIGRQFDYCRNETSVSYAAIKNYKERIEKIIKEVSQGQDHQKEFERRINSDLDNIMEKLRKDFPELKESDFRFLSYVIVGFDATTRAIILNETSGNMRVKKARLLKKIYNSSSENLHLYKCFLN